MHARRTVCTGACGDVIIGKQRVRDLGGVIIADVKCHDSCAFRPGEIAVDGHAVNALHTVVKPPHECAFVCSNSRNIGFFDKFQRGMQSGDAVRIERARLEPCRIRLRLFAVVGVNAGAAAEQRPKLYARSDAQTAGSLRTHQALVAGEAEHVNVHALHVDWHRACRLRCIDNQKGTVFVRHCTDFGDIEQVSGQIGCMRADNGLGFRSKERFHILIADIALTVRRYKIYRYAAHLQIIQRTEHGIVFQISRNDVITGRKQTVECNIQRLGGVRGEHNMVRTRTAEQLRQLAPRFEHHA